jgi:transposase
MRPSGSPEQLERRRVQAIALLKKGFTPVEVARRLGVDRRSVRRWRAAHDEAGRDGLAARPAPGRPPKLDAKAQSKLERKLVRGARACGFATDLWTCPRVAKVIRREFRVKYHVDHIGRLLRSMGWSPQKPERRARERDEEAIRRWVKVDWPRVKKNRGA